MQAESPEALTWIGQVIGNHRLVRVLGRGGMGMVFEAVHEGVLGRAAIKILRPDVTSRTDVTTRFFNEARAANAVQHPGIVRIFDCGFTESGVAYLSMEFLEGESLRSRLNKLRQLPTKTALRVARQIASALAAAHRVHIIHRDLKPDKIMLVPDQDFPGGERVKILDFGIAKMAEGLSAQPLRTKSDVLMGTPTYMAPEQCRGAKLATDRSDVYSLGVILYQMLAGYPPFLGASMGDLIAMHLMDEPPRLTDVLPEISPKIAKLADAMLAKKPDARPSMEKAQKTLLRLEEEAKLEPPLTAHQRDTETSLSDSQQVTMDVPVGHPRGTPSDANEWKVPVPNREGAIAQGRAAIKPSASSRPLPSRIVTDSRHVHIPKRTLQVIVAAFVASTLLVTTGILLGTQARHPRHGTALSVSPEPEHGVDTPATSSALQPVRPTPQVASNKPVHGTPGEPSASSKLDRVGGLHRESTLTVSKHAESSTPTGSRVHSTDPAVEEKTAPVVEEKVAPLVGEKPSKEIPVTTNPEPAISAQPQVVIAPTKQVDPGPRPVPVPERSVEDPFDPLRTAEDFLLQGGYRRAMDLATQFGKQDPMRAWEIYGRAACGMRLQDRASRAMRELQQRNEVHRIQSLLAYCRLHKLPLTVTESQ